MSVSPASVDISLPAEEENNLKFPLRMDYLVLFYCEFDKTIPRVLPSTPKFGPH